MGEFLLEPPLRSRRAPPGARRDAWTSSPAASTSSRTGASRVVTLSTHMDTVPPHVPSREDEERIWGRGACDAKGIIASMIHAAEGLLDGGRAQLRPALRGRRGKEQRRRDGRRPQPARLALPHQRRAEREQAGARMQGRAALRDLRGRQDGALGLPGARRFGHRQAARRARRSCAASRCPWIRCWGRAR